MRGKAKRRRGGRGVRRTVTAESHETSVPTGRAAYADTRQWLLKQHGPVCAYCGVTWPARTMTLDHVTPRRGQTAYDRRDNLVLACKRCNTIKADKPFLAFLFAQRARARNLLRYGEHLSDGILDLCRQLAGDDAVAVTPRAEARVVYGPDDDDGESPYSDSPYKPSASHSHKSHKPDAHHPSHEPHTPHKSGKRRRARKRRR